WNSLGSGTRVSGGWQLGDVLLPTDAAIRARGYVAGGRYHASGGFVESLIHPLFLITQPSDQTNNAGTTATFGVSAVGGAPLHYQWQKGAVALVDGGNIAGATTATLTVSNVLGGDAGAYSVVVSNMDGSITSREAMLTVVDPLITDQPISQQRNGGESAAFNVTVVGTTPLNYQWRKDGVALVDGGNRSGAATASLRLTNVLGGDSGGYSVVVSNQYGSLTSAVAVLIVDDLSLTGQPVSQQRNAGENVAFNVTAVGTSLSYRWWKDGLALVDGANIAGATTASLSLGGVLGRDAGRYWVVVSNQFASITSAVAVLTVVDPVITGQPVSQQRNAGESVTFTVSAAGTALSYQWWKDGMALPASHSSALLLNDLQGADAGLYSVVVSSQYGSLTSAVAVLGVNLATPDAAFNPGPDGGVNALALQSDGKILVGGGFNLLGGQPRAGLARLNGDGTLENGFSPTVNNSVASLVVQTDDKVLVGGGFTLLNGQPRAFLARLNGDGTLDNGFNPGPNNSVIALAAQADGRILVAGRFTTFGGQPRAYMARSSIDGVVDSGFNPGADSVVYA
ncbi:MAG: hypothetical protein NTW03_08235, partial [Verrucomicrobia bacterium]|nr:hypothetical protein [Verrucomicrobiota bacterium]